MLLSIEIRESTRGVDEASDEFEKCRKISDENN